MDTKNIVSIIECIPNVDGIGKPLEFNHSGNKFEVVVKREGQQFYKIVIHKLNGDIWEPYWDSKEFITSDTDVQIVWRGLWSGDGIFA